MNDPNSGFFEEIEHTADLSLRCGGPDLAHLFRNAARGMYHLMGVEKRSPQTKARHSVALAALDVESLLVDWLSELAYLAETRSMVFDVMVFESLSATRLQAELTGSRAARIETLIKAVTFHRLEVEQSAEGFMATVVFDV